MGTPKSPMSAKMMFDMEKNEDLLDASINKYVFFMNKIKKEGDTLL